MTNKSLIPDYLMRQYEQAKIAREQWDKDQANREYAEAIAKKDRERILKARQNRRYKDNKRKKRWEIKPMRDADDLDTIPTFNPPKDT